MKIHRALRERKWDNYKKEYFILYNKILRGIISWTKEIKSSLEKYENEN